MVAAISAIDIALWDIAGKFHEVPVYQLLGGEFRNRVQPYATGFYRISGQGEGKRLADEAIRHAEAGGENEHTLYGFRELLAASAVDIAQPDIGSCGGISAARHITALAQAHGVPVNPHVWGSAIAQAASLQVIAALPVGHHSLFPREPVLEYDRSSHPFRRQLIREPIDLVDGWVEIPARPGLGVEIDRATLERYRAR